MCLLGESEKSKTGQLKEMEGSLKQTSALSQFGLEPDLCTISARLSLGQFMSVGVQGRYIICFI